MDNFSFNRLGLLIKKQGQENKTTYLVAVLSLFSVLAVVFIFWIIFSGKVYQESTIYNIGLVGLYLTGCSFASSSFDMFSSNSRGIYWISFPSSQLEKMLAVLFYNVIVFTLLYVAIFFGLKFLAELYINYTPKNQPFYKQVIYNKVNWSSKREFTGAFPMFCYLYFIAQATFILGSISFKKERYLKSAIILIASFFLLVFYTKNLSDLLFLKGYTFKIFDLKKINNGDDIVYELSNTLKMIIEYFFKFLLAPFIWLITWYKLQEKEVK
ncbi:MAG: hypothetical protein E6Q89_03705 [Bacteroidia bacterium]|nr:MAG: hypothetical protein E6Q89_03705 [Bacteroidia bacterium]